MEKRFVFFALSAIVDVDTWCLQLCSLDASSLGTSKHNSIYVRPVTCVIEVDFWVRASSRFL